MCIEINAPGQAIEIPFESEEIDFYTPRLIKGTYSILVRNVDTAPISRLFLWYPRSLFEFPTPTEAILSGLTDSSEELPDALAHEFSCTRTGDQLSVSVPHPNEPVRNAPNVTGRLIPANSHIRLPEHCSQRHIALLKSHGFTGLIVALDAPILPNEAHWFRWEIVSDRVGAVVEKSLIGSHVFHEFNSPVYVHRTVQETVDSAIRDLDIFKDDQLVQHPLYLDIKRWFELDRERDVDIRYHRLSIKPGDPNTCVLQFWTAQGDLRVQSGPEFIPVPDGRPHPVFSWKSGTLLKPEHPWRDLGFILRLVLQFDPRLLESEKNQSDPN